MINNLNFWNEQRDLTNNRIVPCCGNLIPFKSKKIENGYSVSIFCSSCMKAYLIPFINDPNKAFFKEKHEIKILTFVWNEETKMK